MAPYYEIVEGVRLPARLGGHPALDFCNTWAGWNGGAGVDYLEEYDHLVLWAGFVGLLEPERVASLRVNGGRREKQAAAVLERALRLRTDLYGLVSDRGSATAGPTAAIAEELRAARASLELGRAETKFEWRLAPSCDLEAPVLAAAWSAASLLTSSDLPYVRACPGNGCGWVFLDKRGRRRWCSMAACGNREKVRRFSARRREEGSAGGG
jgi:predicted RNA-binding Zn ribbon-like protein